MVLGRLHGWHRWAATIVLGFERIARISEVLKACRGDLVLPSDQFSSILCSAFLKVSNPKTKKRKGKDSTFEAERAQQCCFPGEDLWPVA